MVPCPLGLVDCFTYCSQSLKVTWRSSTIGNVSFSAFCVRGVMMTWSLFNTYLAPTYRVPTYIPTRDIPSAPCHPQFSVGCCDLGLANNHGLFSISKCRPTSLCSTVHYHRHLPAFHETAPAAVVLIRIGDSSTRQPNHPIGTIPKIMLKDLNELSRRRISLALCTYLCFHVCT